MDIQKIIADLLAKFNVDDKLVAKFKKDPTGTVKGLLGSVNLDDAQLKTVVEAIAAKLKVNGIAGVLGSLFGGKK